MLRIGGLCKRYGDNPALSDLSFQLERGELYALLGPNGAGKSTTLKILAGLTAPDSGRIELEGEMYSRDRRHLRKQIAYVPDMPFLYPKLTGEEHLRFYAELYGMDGKGLADEMDYFFRYFEFEQYREQLVENYSSGTRQKLLISQALLVKPKLLLLDEPLVSIDPLVARKFKAQLRSIGEAGTSTLIATHILPLAEEVSDRIGIIVEGSIRVEGSPAALRRGIDGTLEEFYFKTVTQHEASPGSQD